MSTTVDDAAALCWFHAPERFPNVKAAMEYAFKEGAKWAARHEPDDGKGTSCAEDCVACEVGRE